MAAPYINLSGPYSIPAPGAGSILAMKGFVFNFTGDKIILCAPYNSELYSYTLATPFLISSTITYSAILSLIGIGSGALEDIFIDATGTNAIGMYPSVRCVQYALGTNFDLSTMTVVRSNNALASGAKSLIASQDGTRLYTFGTSTLKQYNLSTPWDISTASLQDTISSSISSFVGTGMWLSPYEKRLFVLGSVSGVYSILRYDLLERKEISGAIEYAEFTPVTAPNPYSLKFNEYETKVYISSSASYAPSISTYDGGFYEPIFWTHFKGQTEYLE